MKRTVFEEIQDYMGMKETVISFLMASLFLFLSFCAHTRAELEPITTSLQTMDVPNAYYGFPFEMLSILSPVTVPQENQVDMYVMEEGNLRFQILWHGLVLNFVMYFVLAFLVVYLFESARAFKQIYACMLW